MSSTPEQPAGDMRHEFGAADGEVVGVIEGDTEAVGELLGEGDQLGVRDAVGEGGAEGEREVLQLGGGLRVPVEDPVWDEL